MKKASREDVNVIISKINQKRFNRRDIKLFLLEIRDYLEKDAALRDIGNFIHPERKLGSAFNKINIHIENFLSVAKNSGIITVMPIYKSSDLLTELNKFLEKEKFEYNKDMLKLQWPTIIKYISQFLDETKININSPEVKNCYLKIIEVNNKKVLTFIFNFNSHISGVLKVPPTVSIAMPFFDDFE